MRIFNASRNIADLGRYLFIMKGAKETNEHVGQFNPDIPVEEYTLCKTQVEVYLLKKIDKFINSKHFFYYINLILCFNSFLSEWNTPRN